MMAVASSPLQVAVVARGWATIEMLGMLIATVAAREVMLLAAASVTITLYKRAVSVNELKVTCKLGPVPTVAPSSCQA